MKRILAFFMCIVMCLGFAGCAESVEELNNEARAVLDKVLNKEEPFTLHNIYIDMTTEEILDNFDYPTVGHALFAFVPSFYTFVDCDADGVEELVVRDMTLTYSLFLRYDRDDGKVYGCVERDIASPGFKTDGSFTKVSLRDARKVICTVAFDKTSHAVTEKLCIEEETGTYQIDGKPVEKAEAEQYFNEWEQNTVNIEWERHPDHVIVIPGSQ